MFSFVSFSPLWFCRKEIDVGNANVGQDVGNEEVRPPLPVKREVLYDDASLYRYPYTIVDLNCSHICYSFL